MNQQNNMPNFEQLFVDKGINSKDWYFFFVGLFNHLAPAAEVAVTPGASPYSYQPIVGGSLIVSGGTVTDISFSRNGTTFYTTGQIAGMFMLNAQDKLRVTYTVVPTITFVPT